jgi:hypothetical protein
VSDNVEKRFETDIWMGHDFGYGEDIPNKLTVRNTTPNSTIQLISTSQKSTHCSTWKLPPLELEAYLRTYNLCFGQRLARKMAAQPAQCVGVTTALADTCWCDYRRTCYFAISSDVVAVRCR